MRSKDRLAELLQLANESNNNGGVYCETVELTDGHIEPTSVEKQIEDIVGLTERIHVWIRQVEAGTELARRLLADPTHYANSHAHSQLDSAVTEAHATSLKISGALRQLESASQALNAAGRTARMQFLACRALFARALERHHALLDATRVNHLHLLKKQAQLANLTISDEECENLLESNNIQLFVENVVGETAAAKLALKDAQARHEELVRIERSIVDVKEMFIQLSHLVATQQDQIDNVQHFALQASDHVESGGNELLKGTVSRKKARKKKIGLIICLASGVLIVLLVLIYTISYSVARACASCMPKKEDKVNLLNSCHNIY